MGSKKEWWIGAWIILCNVMVALMRQELQANAFLIPRKCLVITLWGFEWNQTHFTRALTCCEREFSESGCGGREGGEWLPQFTCSRSGVSLVELLLYPAVFSLALLPPQAWSIIFSEYLQVMLWKLCFTCLSSSFIIICSLCSHSIFFERDYELLWISFDLLIMSHVNVLVPERD